MSLQSSYEFKGACLGSTQVDPMTSPLFPHHPLKGFYQDAEQEITDKIFYIEQWINGLTFTSLTSSINAWQMSSWSESTSANVIAATLLCYATLKIKRRYRFKNIPFAVLTSSVFAGHMLTRKLVEKYADTYNLGEWPLATGFAITGLASTIFGIKKYIEWRKCRKIQTKYFDMQISLNSTAR